jgi:hypothetical protein
VIAGGYGGFFQRHVDGTIWTYDGQSSCATNSSCPGWTLIDRNPLTKDVVAAGNALFQLHTDGSIWLWDNRSSCTPDACPGWTQIDRNPHTKAISAVDTKFFPQ